MSFGLVFLVDWRINGSGHGLHGSPMLDLGFHLDSDFGGLLFFRSDSVIVFPPGWIHTFSVRYFSHGSDHSFSS